MFCPGSGLRRPFTGAVKARTFPVLAVMVGGQRSHTEDPAPMVENVFRAAGLGLLVNSDTEIIDVEALTLHDDHIFRTHQRHLLPTTQAVEEYSPFPTLHTPLEFAWSSPIVAKGIYP